MVGWEERGKGLEGEEDGLLRVVRSHLLPERPRSWGRGGINNKCGNPDFVGWDPLLSLQILLGRRHNSWVSLRDWEESSEVRAPRDGEIRQGRQGREVGVLGEEGGWKGRGAVRGAPKTGRP